MHHEALIEVTGPSDGLRAFAEGALADHLFSFERLLPTPEALHVDTSSFAEDGYAAVAGDWTLVARRDMLREPAAALGLRWPLASREDVLACFAGLGEVGTRQLALGAQIQRNLQQHGHADAGAWRKVHWGAACDCEDVVAAIGTQSTRLAFRLLAAPPKKVFATLSARYPGLTLTLSHVNHGGKRAAHQVFLKGKEVSKTELDGAATLAAIRAFRQAHGHAWLAKVAGSASVDAALQFDDSGKAVFAGTDMALSFALARLRAGETATELAARFPELKPAHLRALELLAEARYNGR